MFWATAPGTKERAAEEKLAREMGLNLRECKPIEGVVHGTIAGNKAKETTMGEEIELTDINGNVVKVALHHALDVLAEAMRGRTPYQVSTKDAGEWLKIDLVRD